MEEMNRLPIEITLPLRDLPRIFQDHKVEGYSKPNYNNNIKREVASRWFSSKQDSDISQIYKEYEQISQGEYNAECICSKTSLSYVYIFKNKHTKAQLIVCEECLEYFKTDVEYSASQETNMSNDTDGKFPSTTPSSLPVFTFPAFTSQASSFGPPSFGFTPPSPIVGTSFGSNPFCTLTTPSPLTGTTPFGVPSDSIFGSPAYTPKPLQCQSPLVFQQSPVEKKSSSFKGSTALCDGCKLLWSQEHLNHVKTKHGSHANICVYCVMKALV